MEAELRATFCYPEIVPPHNRTLLDSEPIILTPVVEASVELKGAAPGFGVSTQKQTLLINAASRKALMRAQRAIRPGIKPADVVLDLACGARISYFRLFKIVENVPTLPESMQTGAPSHGVGCL
jgi:hypothetical protein